MPQPTHSSIDLKGLARRAMLEQGLEPDLPAAAAAQLRAIAGPAMERGAQIRDQRSLLWCSIDNDDSRDLDQLSVAQPLAAGGVRILVAIADVDASIARDTPLDVHARANTTSVYTAAQIFPMLPERLSTDLTCLAEGQERLSMVIDMTVAADGSVGDSEIYRSVVVNRAKLAYDSVAAWLDGRAPPPPRITAVTGMDAQLRTQDSVAQRLKALRQAQGSLTLSTLEAQAVYEGGALIDLKPDESNRAKELIEFFMIAANGVMARFLESRGRASLRRALPAPERWDRIVALARSCNEALPAAPDARALNAFLLKRRQAAPAQFADLSLAIVKLLGAGEYVLKRPGQPCAGHFGLALEDYAHATAPNRRFPDVITQRLAKAALAGAPGPYGDEELAALAQHCTVQERNAAKVERQVRKSAAALLLQAHIGEQFDALVTGASDKGTWVRISRPLAEGRLVKGFAGLDVGDPVRVQLLDTDIERGFIDFARVR
ncbi:MAG: RNB domain-containing ribonuclease [Sinobacteraceae bacterium]|nr:RNB domain-containing ribonuclease [Nevskiaceae bacterium]